MNEKKLHFAWVVLIGVILIRGFAGGGINTVSGLFLTPVSQEIGVGIGKLTIYFSIISIVMVVWLPTAGRLINHLDIRLVAAIGSILMPLSFVAFSFMNHVYGWYLLAIPYAMGATILVNLLGPILIHRWFTKNAGMMMGIQMAFVGLFGAVFQPLTSSIIAGQGWRSAYRLIGLIAFFAVILSTFLFLKNRPEDIKLLPYGTSQEETDSKDSKKLSSVSVQVEEKTAVHSASFYLLLLFMTAMTGVGVFTQHIPTYGSRMGFSIQEIGIALALVSIGNASGSIGIGIVSDKIGSLKTCFGMIGIGITAIVGYLFSFLGYPIFVVSSFFFGLTTSGIMVLSPILTLAFFGNIDYEKIYAKVSMGAPLASIVLLPAYGFLYDWTKNYFWVLVGMLCMLFLAAVCIAVGWKKRCTLDGCPGWKRK